MGLETLNFMVTLTDGVNRYILWRLLMVGVVKQYFIDEMERRRRRNSS